MHSLFFVSPSFPSLSSNTSQPLTPIFERAAADYDIPLELLLVLGQIGSAFEDRGAAPTIERGYGIMALRENNMGGDSLSLAAGLLGLPSEHIKIDVVANIRGAAAVLDAYGRELGIDRRKGLMAWIPIIQRYAGLDDESNQYFTMEVFQILRKGLSITNSSGETFRLTPVVMDIDPENLAPPSARIQSDDYQAAIWDPAASCNYSAYSSGKDTVAIHIIDGSAAGARAWFKNCSAYASAHYVISEIGTIWQMVRETYVAWHTGCYNNRAIGIEHEGYTTSPSHPRELYDSSALLTRDLCNDWKIPKEHTTGGQAGITGHDDIDRCCCIGNSSDPGAGWDWTYYISQVRGIPPLAITAAESRKTHGTAGTFNINILDPGAVEPRSGNATTFVITFNQPVQGQDGLDPADVQLSYGHILGLVLSGNELRTEITGTGNASKLFIRFPGIRDMLGGQTAQSLCVRLLPGDATADGQTNVLDLLAIRSAVNSTVTGDNFMNDINADGKINVLDLLAARNNLNRSVSTCP